jgi:type IV secretory pathway VirD2 relaxase
MVKSRSVRGAGKNGRAAAHLRYIQRDGTSRDGERGRVYSATQDRTDGDAFLDRGKDDRHQFRFIVSPEEGAELGDLSGFTRDLMRQLEGDLGTKLDWVAVNHFNTGHPHVHIIINGRDELGKDLVINGDYVAHGIRERASELVTLELGPVTAIEQQRKLAAEIDQDRFTRIDRALIAEAGEGLVDLRHMPADQRGISDRALRLARLGKLEAMGLASEVAPGRWQLSEKLEPTLRELGERGDVIKTMHRALQADGLARDPASFWIHDRAPSTPIVGRVIDKHLSDELGENLSLIIDGVDGRTHHVAAVYPAGAENISIGSIVEIGSAEAGCRPADRAIAAAAEEGVYRPSRHLEQARFEGRVPGGDHDGFVEAHVRRLEALRRAGIVERIDADHWFLPQDFESRAAAYDSVRNRQLNIRVLSTFDLESQIEAEGATWLDRRLVGRDPTDLVAAGFGRDVQQAMDRRREHLIGQGDAISHGDGRIFYRRNLIATLEQRDVIRTGTALAASRSLPFRAAGDGETVRGVFKQTIELSSGKFALVESPQGDQ